MLVVAVLDAAKGSAFKAFVEVAEALRNGEGRAGEERSWEGNECRLGDQSLGLAAHLLTASRAAVPTLLSLLAHAWQHLRSLPPAPVPAQTSTLRL